MFHGGESRIQVTLNSNVVSCSFVADLEIFLTLRSPKD